MYKHLLKYLMVFLGAVLVLFFNNCDGSFATKDDGSLQAQSADPCWIPLTEAERDPKTIDQAVKLINRLPQPATIECFIANLQKPLNVYAVDNAASAQPSAGPSSPRIFIFRSSLIISVVPAGIGKRLIEFGEMIDTRTTVKGEVRFPVVGTLSPSEPYKRVLDESFGTSCRLCHTNERSYSQISTGPAYSSNLVKPNAGARVASKDLKYFALNCNMATDAERCKMLKAIFIDGQAQDANFPGL
jgi:hypothetical protein